MDSLARLSTSTKALVGPTVIQPDARSAWRRRPAIRAPGCWEKSRSLKRRCFQLPLFTSALDGRVPLCALSNRESLYA